MTQYSVMLEGTATQNVSASTACPTVNCSYQVSLSLPKSQLIKGSVAAENVFGQGQSCTTQEVEVGMLLIIQINQTFNCNTIIFRSSK